MSRSTILLLCVFAMMALAEARVRHYKWDVKYEFKSPDGYKKLAITINGKTPGPAVLAQQGDTVVVEVTNGLVTQNLAIHWHGIRQIGTPWSDGTGGVTQCPILPGDTFTYRFVVDRPGTYLYHAHYGMQREAGLYGSIRVLMPDGMVEPFAHDYDKSIILSDWYHQSTYEQTSGLSSIDFVWVGEPQSLLIQGKGKFDCSKLAPPSSNPSACNATNPECSTYVQTVVPGKTYRLRISSLTALSALSFQIEGHNMTIVEADEHYVEPIVVQNLFIYSGETNYWITTNIVGRNATTPPGLAVLNYYPNHPKRVPPMDPPTGPIWNDVAPRLAQSLAIKARQGYIHTPPPKSDRVIVFLNTQNKIDGYVRWSMNNVSLKLPNTPYLIALKENLHHVFDQRPLPDRLHDFADYDIYHVANNTNATSSNAVYRLKFNTTVDIILQNANTLNANNSETHPWHLHGHDFWVLGYGTGKFDIDNDPKKYNLANPIMKNTVAVHPYGWTALRFIADNPGAWLFHCHIEAHFYMGMGVVFEEGVEKVGKLPLEIMGCGETKGFKGP
ncbi:hypothetical protein NL676_013942 [Syzygium grande]|nr:hypothetical protein NL676_013942 [Syzygium grande]